MGISSPTEDFERADSSALQYTNVIGLERPDVSPHHRDPLTRTPGLAMLSRLTDTVGILSARRFVAGLPPRHAR